jgi:branched-subunit amino acid transport protein
MNSATIATWALILGLAAISFATRAVFTLPERRLRLSPALGRVLRFAPAAALLAIVVPDIARVNGVLDLSFANPRLVAGLAAFVFAAYTRSIVFTIVGGMAVLTLWRVFF